MNNGIHVSVIITIYNKEKTLRRAIDSVLNQTYRDIEVILVNDGSSDSTDIICKEYEKKDCRVVVINKENGGEVSARKTGLRASNGRYIVFVDADDWIDDRMIYEMLSEAQNHNADLVSSSWILHNSKGIIEEMDEVPEGVYETIDKKKELANYTFFNENKERVMNDSLNTRLYKKSLIERCLFPFPNDIVYAEDTFVAFVCFAMSKKTVIKQKCYYHYMTMDSSINSGTNINILQDLNKGYVYALTLLDREGFVEIYKRQLERILLYYMFFGINEFMGLTENHKFLRYFFPVGKVPEGSTIAIYGAGEVGQSYYKQLKKFHKIVYWIDKNAKKRVDGHVVDIESVDIKKIDYVVIAIKDKGVSEEIEEELVYGYRWPAEKIVWSKPQSLLDVIMDGF